jgi:hypothetical protein
MGTLGRTMSWDSSPVERTSRAKWLDILKEVGIIVGVYLVYSLSRGTIDEKSAIAFQHARDVIEWETALGIFVELDIQTFFLKSSFLTDLVNGIYTYAYYPALVGFAIWGYWRHRKKYKFVRTVFVVSAVFAFIAFALYPCAPPRFFDGVNGGEDLGFVDTMALDGGAHYGSIAAFYNPYAAMPSCHFGWSLMVCVAIFWMTSAWWGRLLAASLPTAQLIAIVATGNHFILDAVGGVALLAVSLGVVVLATRVVSRVRSEGRQLVPETGLKESPPY